MRFLDQAKIWVRSGDGGGGVVSFRREKFIPMGGPDGGDGGRGGNVVAVCVDGLNTLIDYRYKQHFRADSGGHGMGQQRSGAGGKAIELRLPPGTQIYAEDGETLLADLTAPGQRIVLAKGGMAGRGNVHFKSSTNQAPRRAETGQPGEELWLWLRLKLIADAGLVGLPNAGKSTLLAAVSAARPKIADYPFTTLVPGLGVVRVDGAEFVLADIPGLIDGAAEGRGLGHRFLRHVERCRVLLQLVDATAETREVTAAFRTVEAELEAYGDMLAAKPRIVVLTKIDALAPAELAKRKRAITRALGHAPLAMSAVSGAGVTEVMRSLWGVIAEARAGEANAPPTSATFYYDEAIDADDKVTA